MIMIGVLVGVAAGIVVRSRWSMLLAAAVFAAVYELDTSRKTGLGPPCSRSPSRSSGLLVLVPILLVATFGAALSRRALSAPRTRQGWAAAGL